MIAALHKRKRYLLLLPLAPGWIIPRIIGTVAFLAHPTWAGLLAILGWWLVVPMLWVIGLKVLKWGKRRYGCFP